MPEEKLFQKIRKNKKFVVVLVIILLIISISGGYYQYKQHKLYIEKLNNFKILSKNLLQAESDLKQWLPYFEPPVTAYFTYVKDLYDEPGSSKFDENIERIDKSQMILNYLSEKLLPLFSEVKSLNEVVNRFRSNRESFSTLIRLNNELLGIAVKRKGIMYELMEFTEKEGLEPSSKKYYTLREEYFTLDDKAKSLLGEMRKEARKIKERDNEINTLLEKL